LWDKAGYIHNEAQKATLSWRRCELKMEGFGCKPNRLFSAGGLGSKYTIRGDFDIQVDCHIDFLEGDYDMDQLLVFAAIGKGKEIGKDDTVFFVLAQKRRP